MMNVYPNFAVCMHCSYILDHFTHVRWHANGADYPHISPSCPHVILKLSSYILTYPHVILKLFSYIPILYFFCDVHATAKRSIVKRSIAQRSVDKRTVGRDAYAKRSIAQKSIDRGPRVCISKEASLTRTMIAQCSNCIILPVDFCCNLG